MLHTEPAGRRQMVGHRVGENVQGPLHPRSRGDRGAG